MPFFVILRHIVDNLSFDDLDLLQKFIKSLEIGLNSSEKAMQFYRLCQTMCEIAALYVQVKSNLDFYKDSTVVGSGFDGPSSQGLPELTGNAIEEILPPAQIANLFEGCFIGSEDLYESYDGI